MFENLVAVLDQIDTAKLNSTLSALAEGVRGQGERIGQATTDANQVLLATQPAQRDHPRRLAGAQGLQRHVQRCGAGHSDDAERREHDQHDHHQPRQAAGCVAAGHDRAVQQRHQPAGAESGQPDQGHQRARADDEPVYKYNPEYTCLLMGAKTLLDTGGYEAPGGNGRTLVLDAGLSLGDDPYHYPDNLPVIGAKGGPGGKPGCGSLPDVAKNWPVRNLVTNTGFGTGMDWRPNPGIGFPAWANYFRSPARCPNRRASATCSAGPRPDRSRTRARRPTVRTCTRRTAPRCGRGCRRRRRRWRRVTQVRRRVGAVRGSRARADAADPAAAASRSRVRPHHRRDRPPTATTKGNQP